MKQQDFTELIPGLPEEIALDCLTRLHYTTHGVSSRVSHRWRELLQSRDFYYHRKLTGHTRRVACLIQSLPVQAESGGSKSVGQPSYGVSVYDPVSGTWDRVEPVPKYPGGMPLFCQVASTEGKLVVMGGWDPASWDPVRDVFVYEFATRRWTQRREMPAKRSFFAVGASGGRVYVAGGHDDSKNALSSAWAYDVSKDEWSELNRMSEERDECEGIMIGSAFVVVSGYDTDSQGRFKTSAESYNIDTGEWSRVEDAWRVSQCPRSCVAVDKSGDLTCWAESDSAVRVGACGVDMGDQTIVTGSAYQDAPQGFFQMERKGGQNGKLVRLEVPDPFSGFVQSGCCVEM
ncbi:hypothetical protein RJ639_004658 [Escallonia herrerae]|uniref:F-box domain-containing protein n=1 Tax=Escallonia herrerae TaxID=1293975 RepID=A0AA89AYI5_9ASTE|nr:hypothetical protein RJ639_004658 [Escallonia herrerae]